MMLANAGSELPIVWVVIGALLVIRIAIGLRRRNRRQRSSAPVPFQHPLRSTPSGRWPPRLPRTAPRSSRFVISRSRTGRRWLSTG